ncbi:MAG: phosphonate C-P lyase system protein PhnH [Alphaproteobacteria bacterium]|nr:phosphonate C-P lyase system protein PhnH [Alphaproteobacteria bacterium]
MTFLTEVSDQSSTNKGIFSGLNNPVHDTAQTFRQLMTVIAEPGKIERLNMACDHPTALSKATSLILLTLLDMDTQLYLAPKYNLPEIRDFFTVQTGTKLVSKIEQAHFVLIDQNTDIDVYRELSIGNPEYPDQSATLIIQSEQTDALLTEVDTNKPPSIAIASGPGIQSSREILLPDLPNDFLIWRDQKNSNFPCGFDMIFTQQSDIFALPRTTKVENQ